jgi:calcineurin-like phosphoesterase family protein
MNIWFTADTHFSHRRIPLYAKRRFCLSKEEQIKSDQIWSNGGPNLSKWGPSWDSISKMNDYLINKINECVRKDDILWHLGDFCFCPKSRDPEQEAQKIFKKINCKNIYFLWGNHDNKKISPFFKECYERYELKHKSKHIVLSHYAQAVWNKSHSGAWMLYGHSHSSAENWLDEMMPGRLSIDVGVDNIYKIIGEYRPISFDELNNIFKNRKGNVIDKSS